MHHRHRRAEHCFFTIVHQFSQHCLIASSLQEATPPLAGPTTCRCLSEQAIVSSPCTEYTSAFRSQFGITASAVSHDNVDQISIISIPAPIAELLSGRAFCPDTMRERLGMMIRTIVAVTLILITGLQTTLTRPPILWPLAPGARLRCHTPRRFDWPEHLILSKEVGKGPSFWPSILPTGAGLHRGGLRLPGQLR